MKWNYVGVAARVICQLIVQIGLARLLGPADFGLFAFALPVIALGGLVVEMGLGAALVQKEQVNERDVRHVFTLALCIGIVLSLAIYAAAPLCATFFNDARISNVLRGLAPSFVLQAFAITPVSLLKRELDFKRVQLVQVASYLFSFLVVGLALAFLHAGVWSLVGAWLVQSLMLAAVFFYMKPHSLKPLFRGGDAALRGFGLRVLLTNLANWSIDNLDNLMVGKFFGAMSLGLYSVSYNLVRTPATHLVGTLQTTLFSATSRAQNNQRGLQRAYLIVISSVALIALPVFCGVAAVAKTVVLALFGIRWLAAASLLAPLAIAMAMHALMAVAGPVLSGKGSPGTELRIQSLTAIVLVVSLFVAGRISIRVMAWAVCAVYALRFIWITGALLRNIGIAASVLLHCLLGGAIAAMLTTPVLIFLDDRLASLPALQRLVVDVAGAGVAFSLFIYLFPGLAVSRECQDFLLGTTIRVPGSKRWFARMSKRASA